MIERKNLDIRIQYLVAEHFFRKSWGGFLTSFFPPCDDEL